MTIEKVVVVDKIEVLEDGVIQVRQATRIVEDGNCLSETFHRWVLVPGQDVADQDSRVQSIAGVIWTPAIVDAYVQQQREIAQLIEGEQK